MTPMSSPHRVSFISLCAEYMEYGYSLVLEMYAREARGIKRHDRKKGKATPQLFRVKHLTYLRLIDLALASLAAWGKHLDK